jgi:hypothetical protein
MASAIAKKLIEFPSIPRRALMRSLSSARKLRKPRGVIGVH